MESDLAWFRETSGVKLEADFLGLLKLLKYVDAAPGRPVASA
jgi:hypothetical protein